MILNRPQVKRCLRDCHEDGRQVTLQGIKYYNCPSCEDTTNVKSFFLKNVLKKIPAFSLEKRKLSV
jgi:hypothetical protein